MAHQNNTDRDLRGENSVSNANENTVRDLSTNAETPMRTTSRTTSVEPPADSSGRLDTSLHLTTEQIPADQHAAVQVEARLDSTIQEVERLLRKAEATNSTRPLRVCPLTIIVPVFNERETLPRVLDRLSEVMPANTQVIVVDDGSTDGTAQWLSELRRDPNRTVICRRRNRGKGSAVRLAIKHSRGKVVAIQDADLEYDPADLLFAVQPILHGEADVVYGSRYLAGKADPSLLHRFGNWALTSLSNALTGLNLTDMETCHKAFRGDLIRSISLRECRFGFEPEITAKVAARGIRIHEISTGYDCRSYEEGKKIGWRDGVSAIACMWRYRNG